MAAIKCHDTELLQKICLQCGLGTLECEPVPLKGGFLHKMYSLFTDEGKYAVKLLNPFIMKRETAHENYRTAEKLEAMLEQSSVPIIPALSCGGRKMQELNGQFFYLYEWYGGKSLKSSEVTESHCAAMGGALAQIHALDRREDFKSRDAIHIDWNFYLGLLADKNRELYSLVSENTSLLYEMQEKGNAAVKKLPPITAVCHNDMDCKNVLWSGDEFRIIDLECLSLSNPFMELLETALCWSGIGDKAVDFDLLRAFVRSYAEAGGQLPADWKTLYDANCGRLEWLEYSLKRSLGIECSAYEIETGISETKNTIADIVYYCSAEDGIIDCLTKL
ncbi:MAG: phosphotransferase [Oscillospiraceae bacterium]|nr:phosphotransferase [Oscillospiraceae bacterium]